MSWIYQTLRWQGSNPGVLENVEYTSIVIASRSTLPGMVAPDRVRPISQIELFNI